MYMAVLCYRTADEKQGKPLELFRDHYTYRDDDGEEGEVNGNEDDNGARDDDDDNGRRRDQAQRQRRSGQQQMRSR